MKRLILLTLVLALPLSAQDSCYRTRQKGCAAGYASRDATATSMIGWGIGIALAIAAVCVLIHDTSSS